jgi:peptidoglycan/LPS O-acetylase OafA/YrhL
MALGRGLVSLALAARPFVVLGDISYAVYLIHHVLVRYYELHQATFTVVPAAAGYTIFWAVLLVAAYVTWTALEKPSRRLLMALAD